MHNKAFFVKKRHEMGAKLDDFKPGVAWGHRGRLKLSQCDPTSELEPLGKQHKLS